MPKVDEEPVPAASDGENETAKKMNKNQKKKKKKRDKKKAEKLQTKDDQGKSKDSVVTKQEEIAAKEAKEESKADKTDSSENEKMDPMEVSHGKLEPTEEVADGKEEKMDSKENKKQKPEAEAKDESDNEETKEEAEVEGSAVLTETTFSSLGVCEPLVKACNISGWKTATRIQEEVLPYALKGRDVIGLAETGSGKTGAFCLPLLQDLLDNPIRGAVFGLILTPTRELAFQIHQVLQALSGTIGATSLCIVGGVDKTSQSIALARAPHVIIATPGRLIDHLENTKGFHLRKLRYLVLDEADRMLSLDFEEELNKILDVIPEDRRTLLFSATMTSKVQKLQRASLTNPVKLEVSTKFQTPKQLLQSYLFIPAKYKDCYLTWLIHEHAGKSILVFGATCNNVERLALMLRNLGFAAICLHGQMTQPKRLGALQKFQSGDREILICTDVASRGLDIPSVDVVINFDLPGHGKDYIHRVGRTARAGRSGKAIALVTQYDVEVYMRLEALLGRKLAEYKLDEETVLVLLERVNEAQRMATRELKEQLASRKDSGGRRKHRRSSDDDVDGGEENGLQGIIEKELRKGYAGGSGGRGGALPNQRGYSGKGGGKKKQRR
ncbi:dependent RNA helicase [Seminavis robusta]|uniref:Dependent RNA helicase n=1 Tax=Seminavis robusta TaxID=568900 RepID=A0A9N8H5B2_9STRA|nr:dependent RNA helicase [Seminavis robusta]|eukprot:Sro82_g043770.1 dependent RNA helicase (612) ;mRNA; f:35135-37296